MPRNKTQKLELQRAAIDCLSTTVSRAGPEMTGMLVAHRVPAVLCSLIRKQQRFPPAPADGSGAASRGSAAPARSSRFFVLAPPAVRALAQLVHSTGPQWCPLRPMPFGEGAAAAKEHQHQQGRHHRASSPSASTARPSTSAGIAVDVNAAVELAASVWRQTAKNLLETADDGGDGGGSGDCEHGRATLAAAAAAAAEEAGSKGVNAVAVLCTIVCEVNWNVGCAGESDVGVGAVAGAFGAPFCGQPRRSFEGGGLSGPTDSTRLATLRVLLQVCRASPGVAHAVAAFGGGAVVRALLRQASLPSSAAGPNVS